MGWREVWGVGRHLYQGCLFWLSKSSCCTLGCQALPGTASPAAAACCSPAQAREGAGGAPLCRDPPVQRRQLLLHVRQPLQLCKLG